MPQPAVTTLTIDGQKFMLKRERISRIFSSVSIANVLNVVESVIRYPGKRASETSHFFHRVVVHQ